MRIAFFGLPLAACLLQVDGHEVVFAATSRIDAPGGRRLRRLVGADRVVHKPPLDAALVRRVEEARPDLVVSWFWTTKISSEVVGVAPLGGFGVHPSLLPRHRGPDPTTWAILSGDPVTGVTAHRLAAEYDTGAILGQRTIAIDPSWNAWQLAKALDRPSLALLREIASRFARSDPPREVEQDGTKATAAPFIEPDDPLTSLHFGDRTEVITTRIRALSPSPGAATLLGEHEAIVLAARACPAPALLEEPGEAAFLGGRAIVRTSDGAIELLEVEVEGEILKGGEIGRLLASPSED